MITTKSKHLSDVDYIHIHNVLEGIAMHCRAISKSVRMVWRSVADRIIPMVKTWLNKPVGFSQI